jgi:5-methylcytosine-specific restriction endonuclease McrA
MRDEYTELIEEQGRIERDFMKQRRWYEQLNAEQDDVKQKLYELRERIIAAQGEQCAYCGAHLRSNRAYQLDQELQKLEREGDIDRETLTARRAEEAIPYLYRVPVQIRLKVPKSRGGYEVMENLVACCAKCGPKKHNKTHEEFLLLLKEE